MLEIICPKCKGGFKEYKHRGTGIAVDICQLCHLMWFDKDEFWATLKNKEAKRQFKKKGLINQKKTKHKCSKCRDPDIFLDQGVLPMTTVEVEHCTYCKSFLFDYKEYQQSKKEVAGNLKNFESAVEQDNLEEVKEDDFSTSLFLGRLDKLKSKVYEFTRYEEKPGGFRSINSFFSRMGKAFRLIFKEPEIILFSLLQAIFIYIAYLIWVQMLNWIPEEVWRSTEHSDEGSIADLVLILWSLVCVSFAALPIGLFTACMGAVHILTSQGKESTISRCFKFVFPKTWPLWVFSCIDAWITVKQILARLPKKDDRTTPAERALSEAMYYAWKIGTVGVIPSLITTKNTWQACKNSFGLLKHKTMDVLLLRGGYSAISWIIGILAYGGAVFTVSLLNIGSEEEVYSHIYTIYLYTAIPAFIAVGFLHVFIRPFYILALFDVYSDYMIETGKKIVAPKRNAFAQTSTWVFAFIIVLIIIVFLFREELGIMKMLATPYGEKFK